MNNKAYLRKLYKEKREGLGAKKRQLFAAKIKKEVVSFVSAHKRFQHFHIFLPIERLNEIDTFPIVASLLADGKQVYTSVTDFSTGDLRTVKINPNTKYIKDKWGIPVPVELEEAELKSIEVVFMPLLAYDLAGNRVGYGKGFYDRFLRKLDQDVYKIGLSYFVPEVSIEAEDHDIPMDICILPSGIIEFK
ncbi:5-formyltetrahydrofolate cyclo-ligase [Echinicola sediminis]